jgi:septal ring factor EnvC (AmiA/AmiB activator)
MEKVTTTLGGAARKARVPALAAGATAMTVAGAALLRRQLAPKRRKVLGVPMPTPHLDGVVPSQAPDLKSIARGISQTGKRVAKAGQQLSKLSDDVERVGKTAQKTGDSLS